MNNKQQAGAGLGLDDFMEEFKKFMEHNGKDPEEYDDLVFDIVEVMSLHDAFVSELMAARKEEIKKMQQQQQQGEGSEIMTPQNNSDIVTPDF